MITLRDANDSDIDDIVVMGREMHQESVYSFLPFSETKCRQRAMDYIQDDNACAFITHSNSKECAGMHFGSLTSYFFGDALLASGLVTYVHPRYRGGRAAILLIREFIEWGKLKNAEEVYIGVSAGVNTELSHKLFKHLGFRHVGGNYKLTLA